MAKILVTGANGQLGSELRDLAKNATNLEFKFTDSDTMDISNEDSVMAVFNEYQPDWCINCAAYTAVDNAENDRERSMLVNATAAGYLAKASHSTGSKFIHISTDYVFPGNANTPYKEDDDTKPVNYYGLTKLEGEKLVKQSNPEAVIIRTSWVYSYYGKNFVKTMLRLMAERAQIGVVADQFGSPTYAADLAIAILKIVTAEKFVAGIFNFSNTGIINWHQFAQAIKEISGSKCIVNAIASTDYPTPAARPAYSAFDTSKIANTYGIVPPHWRHSLEICLNKLLVQP